MSTAPRRGPLSAQPEGSNNLLCLSDLLGAARGPGRRELKRIGAWKTPGRQVVGSTPARAARITESVRLDTEKKHASFRKRLDAAKAEVNSVRQTGIETNLQLRPSPRSPVLVPTKVPTNR